MIETWRARGAIAGTHWEAEEPVPMTRIFLSLRSTSERQVAGKKGRRVSEGRAASQKGDEPVWNAGPLKTSWPLISGILGRLSCPNP